MQVTLQSIVFRYGTTKLVEVAGPAIEPGMFRRGRATQLVHTTRMVQANTAVFRLSIDRVAGSIGAEPVIEVTVPFNNDLAESASRVKDELIALGHSITADDMDFGALESASITVGGVTPVEADEEKRGNGTNN
jgi:hypothetical protein